MIADDGTQLGIMPPQRAMALAQEKGLDLVEVAPNAKPPVCRFVDWGKFQYESKKKLQESRKKQAKIVIKEIKLRPKIEEHDYQVKKRHVEDFLRAGCKVKVTIRFRGREVVRPEMGQRVLERLLEDIQEVGKRESAPLLEGRQMVMMVGPVKPK